MYVHECVKDTGGACRAHAHMHIKVKLTVFLFEHVLSSVLPSKS